jgi:hypothetical protein
MLTLQDLIDMQPHKHFTTGITVDSPDGVNMNNSGKGLKWVAVRGEIHDWAIYIGLIDDSFHHIATNGDKIHDTVHIKRCVPCDDEALAMYRY